MMPRYIGIFIYGVVDTVCILCSGKYIGTDKRNQLMRCML